MPLMLVSVLEQSYEAKLMNCDRFALGYR